MPEPVKPVTSTRARLSSELMRRRLPLELMSVAQDERERVSVAVEERNGKRVSVGVKSTRAP